MKILLRHWETIRDLMRLSMWNAAEKSVILLHAPCTSEEEKIPLLIRSSPKDDNDKLINAMWLTAAVICWVSCSVSNQRVNAIYNPIIPSRLVCAFAWTLIGAFAFLADPTYPIRKYFLPTFATGVLVIVAGYCYSFSLTQTTMTINTAIYETVVIWVYLFNLILGTQTFYLSILFGTIICVIGATLVTAAPDPNKTDTPLGIITVLVSTVCFAITEIIAEHHQQFPKEKQFRYVMCFVGQSGFWLFSFYTIAFYLYIDEVPNTEVTWRLLQLGFVDVICNVTIYGAIARMNAFTVSLAALMVGPVSFLYDIFVNGVAFNSLKLLGCTIIIGGVIFVQYVRSKQEKREHHFKI